MSRLLTRAQLVLALLSISALVIGCATPETPVVDGRQGRTESTTGGDTPGDETAPEPYGPLLAQGPSGGNSNTIDDWERERNRRLESRGEISNHYYEVGRKLFDESKFEQAKRNFSWAVDSDPTNVVAQRMLDLTQWMLEERDGEVRFLSDAFLEEKLVLIDMKKVEVKRYYDAGAEAFNQGEYQEASENLERVLEIIQWFPFEIDTDTGSYRSQAEQLLAEAHKSQRNNELAERIEREKSAFAEALAEEGEVQSQRERKIRTLIERCTDLLNRKKYDRAEDVATEILENFDREHPLALKLRQLAIEGRHVAVAEKIYDLNREHTRRTYEKWDEALIQYEDYIVWPSKEEWLEKRLTRREGISDELEEPEWIRAAKAKLQITVALDLVELPLSDVIEDFRRLTGLNFVVHKDVELDTEVTLVVPEITLENALKVILKEAGLAMNFSDEAIMILPPEEVRADTFLEIYPVDDLLSKLTNFTAPDLSVQDPSDQGGAGGGFTPFSFGDDDDDDSEPLDEDKLVEIIEAQTGDEAWEDDELTSIEVHRGQLLVRNTREVHGVVREVLDQLRANTGIYVVVEARFIDVFDDFLRDIGVDFRGLGQGNPAFGSQFNLARQQNAVQGGRQGSFFDVGFTRRNVNPGLGNGPNAGPGPGNQNFAGRMQNQIDRFPGFVQTGNADSGPLLGGGGGTLVASLLDPFQIAAIFRAEEAHREQKLIDSPTVVAHDRQKVYVAVVTQQSYVSDYDVSAQSFGNAAIEIADPIIRTFEQGVSLEVRPTVSADRRFIHLDLRPTLARGQLQDIVIASLGTLNPQVPAATNVPIQVPLVSLQQSWTSVTVPDGGTALLGGLRLGIEQEDESSVPFLNNIPIIDNLFKREVDTRTNKSLIILVTARIIVVRDEEKARFNED